MNNELDSSLTAEVTRTADTRSAEVLGGLLQREQYVGEVVSITYETATIQIHDYQRQAVGGVPALSFLVASRLTPPLTMINADDEDSSVILLRVMDATDLPNSREAQGIRVETARSVSGEVDRHWDSEDAMDADTRMVLGYAGVKCRILGTFFLDIDPQNARPVSLCFGSDIANYYPNRGLKVYKPNAGALESIVNYVQAGNLADMASTRSVELGVVRYASTNRPGRETDVPVTMYPADLLTQKTAVFGMTRMGKSNTMKIIAEAVYRLRNTGSQTTPKGADINDARRVGQLIFDTDGEYANENIQDTGALKNVWRVCGQNTPDEERVKEVATYGVTRHPQDAHRRLMRFNFYRDADLQIGKEIINGLTAEDPSKYMSNFRDIRFEAPDRNESSNRIRYERRVLCYRVLLHKAGFDAPDGIVPRTRSQKTPLFGEKLLKAMNESEDEEKQQEYRLAAAILGNPEPTWAQLQQALKALRNFVNGGTTSGYQKFNNEYLEKSKTGSWADDGLLKILEMFHFQNGSRAVGRALEYHSADVTSNYADDIYNDLCSGKLVIVDASTGEPHLNEDAADRIMWRIFRGNQETFRSGNTPPDILIYIEEAHIQLPSEREADLTNVWVRTAKEGAKFHIGMVYATQEVSSIQRNILKNTANWFIGHLNNTDETRELRKYYDFADFEKSILRAQDKGFLRVRTRSSSFVIPVQVKRFSASKG